MKKMAIIIKFAAGLLASALGIYLFAAVAIRPEDPRLFLLAGGREKVDRFWEHLGTKPILYPSRREAIRGFIETGGGLALEGYISVVDFSGLKDHIQSYTWPVSRRKIGTWKVRNNHPGEFVSWLSAVCPERTAITFVFSGALGVRDGKSELLISGDPVLVFDTGPDDRPPVWENRKVRLAFFPVRKYTYETGIFCLTVPAEMISPGQSLLIGVRRESGRLDHSFFALHGHRDTLKLIAEN